MMSRTGPARTGTPHRRTRPAPSIGLAFCLQFLAACTTFDRPPDPARYATWEIATEAGDTALIDGLPVRSGQIVVGESGSARGFFLTLSLAEPDTWTHAGLVAVENGRAVVYEAVGVIRLPLLGSPSDNVDGNIHRVTLGSFIDRHRAVALYDPPADVDTERMVKFARASFADGLPFDPYFNLGDPTRAYCSEFVALALAAGGGAPPATLPLNPNPSLQVMGDWLKVAAQEVIPAGALVAPERRVALFSREHSPAQVSAYAALKRELHRRFTPDQKVGNVFSFSRISGLAFRPAVRDFIATVDREAADWDELGEAEIERRVVALARRELGTYTATPAQLAGPAPDGDDP